MDRVKGQLYNIGERSTVILLYTYTYRRVGTPEPEDSGTVEEDSIGLAKRFLHFIISMYVCMYGNHISVLIFIVDLVRAQQTPNRLRAVN